MAHARLVAGLAACWLSSAACGGAPSQPIPNVVAPSEPPAFTTGARLARFHSTRFGVSLPLPDGPRWRIDDHKTPLLRATHEGTQSSVELVVWREEDLMNHAHCEERAREKGFAKELGAEEIDAETIAFPENWDTHISVAAEHDEKTITGHLTAFGASIHKCLYFHFTTRVPNAPGDAISDRLAFARLRIFGEIRLDSFDVARVPERVR